MIQIRSVRMIRLISRGWWGLFLVLALAVRCGAQYGQDLYINNVLDDPTGQIIMSGSPTLNLKDGTPSQLLTGTMDSSSPNLVLYDASDSVIGVCPLTSTWIVHVPLSSGEIDVTIGSALSVTNTKNYSFSAIAPPE